MLARSRPLAPRRLAMATRWSDAVRYRSPVRAVVVKEKGRRNCGGLNPLVSDAFHLLPVAMMRCAPMADLTVSAGLTR